MAEKVLIVDDDKFLLNMYSLKFKKSGYDVTTATSGKDALDKLKEGLKPEMIILDLIMPQMDGLEMLEAMRKENVSPDSVIVVLTNQGEQTDIERSKKLGVGGYIVKATTIPSEVITEVINIYNNNKKKG